MPDYLAKARALRAKAADPVVPPGERAALLEKARNLEAKYRNPSSSFTDDTTVISRDGSPPFGSPSWDHWMTVVRAARRAEAERIAENLAENQWAWNTQYYDRNGTPRSEDHDDIMEETYKYDPEDEDYGYDEFQRDDSQ